MVEMKGWDVVGRLRQRSSEDGPLRMSVPRMGIDSRSMCAFERLLQVCCCVVGTVDICYYLEKGGMERVIVLQNFVCIDYQYFRCDEKSSGSLEHKDLESRMVWMVRSEKRQR